MGNLKNKCLLKHFYSFLKNKNILDKYFVNFTSLHNIAWRKYYEQEKTFDIYVKDRLSKSTPQLIRYAFDWEESEEGFGFWDDKNDLWEKEYTRIKKKYLCHEKVDIV